MFFKVFSEQPPVQPSTIFEIFGWPITNAMLLGIILTIALFFISLFIMKRSKYGVPSKFMAFLEMLVDGMLTLVQQITGKRDLAEKIFPLIGTIFVFFALSNLMGVFPIITSFTFGDVPLLRTPTNDFNMTFSVALALIILTQIASMSEFGLFGHIGKYIKIKGIINGFKDGFGAGMLAIVDFLIGILDIVSEFAKVISLSLRLFGNMYAGEVLAGVVLGAFALLAPTPLLAMSILVAILQAVVFGSLTAAYYTLAVQRDEAETS